MFRSMGQKAREMTGKKKKAGRAFALLLSAALCVECLPVTVWAQEPAVNFENMADPAGDSTEEAPERSEGNGAEETPGKPEGDGSE